MNKVFAQNNQASHAQSLHYKSQLNHQQLCKTGSGGQFTLKKVLPDESFSYKALMELKGSKCSCLPKFSGQAGSIQFTV